MTGKDEDDMIGRGTYYNIIIYSMINWYGTTWQQKDEKHGLHSSGNTFLETVRICQ